MEGILRRKGRFGDIGFTFDFLCFLCFLRFLRFLFVFFFAVTTKEARELHGLRDYRGLRNVTPKDIVRMSIDQLRQG